MIVGPLPGTVAAKETLPAAGASTGSPGAAAMSIPRCWPPAYGWAESNTNGRSTSPPEGHVHARAPGTAMSRNDAASRAMRRTVVSLLSVLETSRTR